MSAIDRVVVHRRDVPAVVRVSWVGAVLFACSACSTPDAEDAPDSVATAPDATRPDAELDVATTDDDVRGDEGDEGASGDTRDGGDGGDARPAIDSGDATTAPFVPPAGCVSDAGPDDAAAPDVGETGIGDADIAPTPTWRALANLNHARGGYFTFAIGDRLLVIGGTAGYYGAPAVLPNEVYDPIADKWTDDGEPPSPVARFFAAVLLADDRVLAVLPGQARVYDANFRVWSDVAPSSLCNPGLLRLSSGRVLAAGGACGSAGLFSAPTHRTEIYDPAVDAWTEGAPMATDRDAPQLLPLGGDRILALGGDGGRDVEVYDPALDRWTLLPRSPFGALGAAAGPLPSGRVLVALSPPDSSAMDAPVPFALLDPTCGVWTRAAWLPTWMLGESLMIDRAGHVIAGGGSGHSYHMSTPGPRATGVYDEALDRWTLLAPLAKGTQISAVLASGAMVSVGGSYTCGKMCSARWPNTSVLDAPP